MERAQLVEHMLTELRSPRRPPSEWELTFLSSVSLRHESGVELTDKQFAVLKRIYDEKTA